jgi:DNA invertase Pin-like site-specific DNA recombinase
MNARVYSYIRFSDARQAIGASSERQRAYAEQWAQQHGLQLDEQLSLRDEGLSAYHQKHVRQGALGAFLKAVEDGAVPTGSVLVVEGLDRLSRAEPIQAQAQLAAVINAGISVVTASDGKVYSRERLKANPMDLVYSLLVMIRAHEESDTKSKRVRDAIRRQCEGWVAGTYRGLIRYGKTPGWLHVVDGRWELISERAQAVSTAVELFRQGLGTGAIAKSLYEAGLAPSASVPTSGHLVRLFCQPALVGDKVVQLDGQEYVLRDYYPPVISREVRADLQRLTEQRGRRKVKGDIPSILTGLGITVCGYCGAPMKSQNMSNTRKADGSMLDSNRRLNCIRVNAGESCHVAGSCSVVPIERALLNYCSDMVNLQALYTGDRAAGPRSELSTAQARLAEIDRQLDRLTDALISLSDAVPATFAKRARELEAERELVQQQLKAAERALAEAVRADITGADKKWRALADGVLGLDYTARMQARQLVADTFERLVVYRKGIRPGGEEKLVDIQLMAKGGASRLLRINAAGEWFAGEELVQA